jgi:basic membrane protein A
LISRRAIAAIVLAAVITSAGTGTAVWWYGAFAPPGGTINPETPPSLKRYNFGIVFATGGVNDHGINAECYKGALAVAQAYGLNFTYAEPTTASQYEPMLRNYTQHTSYAGPFSLIISVGFDQADALMKVAHDYPYQKFAIVDMFIDPGTYPNVASLLFNEHEGSALVGALAGLYTTKDKLGFISGMSIALVWKYAAGYFWGANLTNPGLNIRTDTQSASCVKGYVGDWSNVAAWKALADVMYQTSGTDIIFSVAMGSDLGVVQSAKENNASLGPLWAIGSDTPRMYLGCANPDSPAPPTIVLTSMLKRYDVAVYEVVRNACITGTFTGGVKLFSLASGGVGWENNPALKVIPPAYMAQVNMIAQAIINGTYTVPTDYPWLH